MLEASIAGARRAICSVTCGQGVTLYEAQECVQRINEQAGGNIDIKFGVSINEQLQDSMLVSVIASDFTDEYDFTSVPKFEMPADPSKLGHGVDATREETVQKIEGETEKKGDEPENIASDLLPKFLKGDDDDKA